MFIYSGVNSELPSDHLASLEHTENVDRIEQGNEIRMRIYKKESGIYCVPCDQVFSRKYDFNVHAKSRKHVNNLAISIDVMVEHSSSVFEKDISNNVKCVNNKMLVIKSPYWLEGHMSNEQHIANS